MTVTQAVTLTMAIAVVGTGEGTNLETGHWHTLLIDTQRVVSTASTLWCQTRVHVVNAKVDQSCPAGDDPATRVDEGM